ncbi:MAG: HAD-IIIC family phosphatase [bacterium]
MTYNILNLPWLPKPDETWRALVKNISGDTDQLGTTLKSVATFALEDNQHLILARKIKSLIEGSENLYPLSNFNLGILSAHNFDIVKDYLPAASARHGVALTLFSSEYNQVVQSVIDPSSAFCQNNLDAVLLALDAAWFGIDDAEFSSSEDNNLDRAEETLETIFSALANNIGCPIIIQTIPYINKQYFGSYDRQYPGSPINRISAINDKIIDLCKKYRGFIFDVAAIANKVGLYNWYHERQWFAYKFPFNSDCIPLYADHLARILGAIRGQSRKCLVLDLDNTLWGGVIGDDGIDGIILGQGHAKGEAHLALQHYAMGLYKRGIFLAISSKNEEEAALLPFNQHSDMVLRPEHISIFQANWKDKASNLCAIAEHLNIDNSALVFVDDNPAERAQMRAALPQVAVPELPTDPAYYVTALNAAGYFEAISFSQEDRLRPHTVAADMQRVKVKQASLDTGDYLEQLEMRLQVKPFNELERTRITQLINKTNQFNLTTKRYTQTEVEKFEQADDTICLQARLSDRFGDMGMISVIIATPLDEVTLEIDSWLMSCRVLGRDVEKAMLSGLIAHAKEHGIEKLIGYYRPTPKNALVKDHYHKLGFSEITDKIENSSLDETIWELDISAYNQPCLPLTLEREG